MTHGEWLEQQGMTATTLEKLADIWLSQGFLDEYSYGDCLDDCRAIRKGSIFEAETWIRRLNK